MNLDPSETKLENLLRSLVPDAPSPVLMERIDEELKLDMSWLNATARPPRRVNWISSVGWSAFGAAAAVAVMTFMPAQPQGAFQSATTVAVTAPPAVLPVSTKISEWDDLESQPRADRDRSPREQTLVAMLKERQAWGNARNQSRITLTVPDEEKLVLPVNFIGEAPLALPGLRPYQY